MLRVHLDVYIYIYLFYLDTNIYIYIYDYHILRFDIDIYIYIYRERERERERELWYVKILHIARTRPRCVRARGGARGQAGRRHGLYCSEAVI